MIGIKHKSLNTYVQTLNYFNIGIMPNLLKKSATFLFTPILLHSSYLDVQTMKLNGGGGEEEAAGLYFVAFVDNRWRVCTKIVSMKK